MSSPTTMPPRDQASRLRALVSSLSGPGVSIVTWADRNSPASAANRPAPATPVRREVAIPVVAITSGKGGVGKTSVSVNLAIALARRGVRISLVDADLGLANADLLCGLNPTTRLDAAVDLSRTPGARRSLEQIAVKAPGGFRLVPGSVGLSRFANLQPAQREQVLDGLADLERESDLILIDTGAGLNDGVTSFVREADLVLVVATPEPTSIADSYALMKCLVTEGHPPVFALVANMVESESEALNVHQRLAATCKRFLGLTLPLVGIVRHDEALIDSVRERRPVMLGTPRARCSRDIEDLAARLMRTLNVGPVDRRNGRRTLFGWLSGR
ncbi:Flagellum site-determining protein YlxH [Phycisphaerales bacterium]|nr:Flagellum site-determining protein YlxH [Phycisphaerales bacterium]